MKTENREISKTEETVLECLDSVLESHPQRMKGTVAEALLSSARSGYLDAFALHLISGTAETEKQLAIATKRVARKTFGIVWSYREALERVRAGMSFNS